MKPTEFAMSSGRAHRALGRLRALVAPVLERPAWVLALVALALGALAYQIPFAFNFAAADVLSTRQEQGFFELENSGGTPYRWTHRRATIVLLGMGSGVPLSVMLNANGIRRQGRPSARVHVTMNGTPLQDIQLTGQWAEYKFMVPAARDPNQLRLEFSTDTFSPRGDKRKVGFGVSELHIRPVLAGGITLPAPLEELYLVLIAVGMYCITRRVGFGRVVGFGAGMVGAILTAGFIALARPLISDFSPTLVWIVLGAYVLLLVMPPVVQLLFQRGGVRLDAPEARWMWAVFILFFMGFLIAILFPGQVVGDSLFHLHRLQDVMSGKVILTSSQGAVGFERPIPYPSALYLVLTPLTTLFGSSVTLLKVFVVWLVTTSGLAVYFMVRRGGGTARAACLAMLLDLALPISYLIFEWAIYANLMAQAFMIFALAVWVSADGKLSRKRLVLLGFLLTVTLMSHVTALPLLVVFFMIALGIRWFYHGDVRRWALRPALALGLALALVLLLFYSNFGALVVDSGSQIAQARLERGIDVNSPLAIVGGGVSDSPNGLVRLPVYSVTDWIVEGAAGLAQEAWVYLRIWTLLLAPFGFVLLARNDPSRVLVAIVWAGFLTAIFFAVVGLALDVYVRYALFVLPFAAIGSGVALDALTRRGRVWTLGVVALVAITIVGSLPAWLHFFLPG